MVGLLTPVLIVGSIVASTCLILINKQAMSVHGWQCPTFLTSYHFLLTGGLLTVMAKMKLFEPATTLPSVESWKMAAFGVISIVFMNFNLKVNSIGFYQLSKLCTIPCLVIYKFVVLKQSTPSRTLLSLGVLLIGLCLFTVNDVQFSFKGCIVALIAVITTAAYQTMTGQLQKTFSISGTQLSHKVGFPQFVICFIAGCILETSGEHNIFNQTYTFTQIALVLASGVCAVIGNVIAFSLIGKAGPVTFQVVGHVKTMLIFVFGLIMFPDSGESSDRLLKKIMGLAISMTGVIMYTIVEIQTKNMENKKGLRAQEMVREAEDDALASNDNFADVDDGYDSDDNSEEESA